MTFAVGAVTGTVLSFEFGLLWPEFTGRFGEVFGVLFAIEGIFFFLEAIFIAIYIFGWKRLSGLGALLDRCADRDRGIGGAFSVVAVNSWMNQPQGYTLGRRREGHGRRPWKVIFNDAVPYEVPHMILAAYLVTGFLVASVYAVGMLRGRRDRHHRLGLLIPLTVAAIATPIQFAVGDTAAREIAKDQPIKFAAMECVQETSTDVPEYLGGPLHLGRRKRRHQDSGPRLVPRGLEHRHGGDRARLRASRRPPTREHAAALGLRRDGGNLHGADPARPVARDRLAAQARHPEDALVPARGRGVGGGGDRGARVRLDRDRGRSPALDRVRGDAHRGRGHGCERRVDHAGG